VLQRSRSRWRKEIKVVVVGGSGFVGFHMSRVFVDKGIDVIIMTPNPNRESYLPEKVGVVAATMQRNRVNGKIRLVSMTS
jgi:nucleoside-diphosphate-sugar epimerase